MKKKQKNNPYLVEEGIKYKTKRYDLVNPKKDKFEYGVLHPLKSCLNKGQYFNVGKKTAYKLNKGAHSNKVFII